MATAIGYADIQARETAVASRYQAEPLTYFMCELLWFACGNGGRPATAFVLTVRIVKRRAQLKLGAPRRVDVVYVTQNQEQVVAAPTPCRFHQPGKCPHGENVIFISNSSLAQ